ncbi:hypothetical protein TorRG33x02_049040, partial [Trema orientale]
SEMKRCVCFSLLFLLILLSQCLQSSAHQGVMYPNLHDHHGRRMSPKPKDILISLELAQKPRIYVRKKGFLSIFGIAIRGGSRGKRTSSANGDRPAFLYVFLCFTLFLGIVLA